VVGLLFFATTINYMDRVTLGTASVRVTGELGLSNEQYGHLELAFGWAFAVGSFCFGLLADRVRVAWLYPAVLGCWSLMGVLTGWTHDFPGLLVCRALLGFFEAGHWPCAVRTTMAVLSDRERTLGNSILQAGSSVGAVITPQVMKWLLTDEPGSWRHAFVAVGCVGFVWIVPWLFVARGGRIEMSGGGVKLGDVGETGDSIWAILLGRRFWAVAVLITGAQMAWHIYRVWMMKFLQQGRGMPEVEALNFNSLYFASTDAGCLLAGGVSVWLVNRGLTAHGARRRVYLGACFATSAAACLPWLDRGTGLLVVLMLVGAGALALFPCYYSFVQDLSERHVGKLTGLLSMWVWAVTSPLHSLFGMLVDRTGSYDAGMVIAGLMPWLGVLAMRLGWGPATPRAGSGRHALSGSAMDR
jgi:ACS family hexuronate transporter-like MFS transporter